MVRVQDAVAGVPGELPGVALHPDRHLLRRHLDQRGADRQRHHHEVRQRHRGPRGRCHGGQAGADAAHRPQGDDEDQQVPEEGLPGHPTDQDEEDEEGQGRHDEGEPDRPDPQEPASGGPWAQGRRKQRGHDENHEQDEADKLLVHGRQVVRGTGAEAGLQQRDEAADHGQDHEPAREHRSPAHDGADSVPVQGRAASRRGSGAVSPTPSDQHDRSQLRGRRRSGAVRPLACRGRGGARACAASVRRTSATRRPGPAPSPG